MPLVLQDPVFADGPAMGHLYISAFVNDEFHNASFPGMSFEKQVAGAVSRWPNNYGDISSTYKKVVDTGTGKIVSYSKWGFVNTDAFELRKINDIPPTVVVKPPSTPEGLNDPFATEHTAKIKAVRARVLEDRPYLLLKMLGTDPTARRRGAASLQLEWAVSMADNHGLICWVEASPEGIRLYEKFNFEVKGTVVMDLPGGGTYTHFCMLRKPDTKESS